MLASLYHFENSLNTNHFVHAFEQDFDLCIDEKYIFSIFLFYCCAVINDSFRIRTDAIKVHRQCKEEGDEKKKKRTLNTTISCNSCITNAASETV